MNRLFCCRCAAFKERSAFERLPEDEDPALNRLTSFRCDGYYDWCDPCRALGYPSHGRVYYLACREAPELCYVGSTVVPLASRVESHWVEALYLFHPDKLHTAMREHPDRDAWVAWTLQDDVPAEHLRLVESAWCLETAVDSGLLPSLNARIPYIPRTAVQFDKELGGFRVDPTLSTGITRYDWSKIRKARMDPMDVLDYIAPEAARARMRPEPGPDASGDACGDAGETLRYLPEPPFSYPGI